MATNVTDFTGEITIRNIPMFLSNGGRVIYVNNGVTGPGEAAAGPSDSNDGTYPRPYKTLAKGLSVAVADRGDVVVLGPGHAETYTTAAAAALSTSCVAVYGIGQGEDRAKFTFATSTASNITMTGNQCALINLVFVCNIASQVNMINITAKDYLIDRCSFREGSADGLSFITVGAASNDSDRGRITRCDFYNPTATYNNAIKLNKATLKTRIQDCDFYGDYAQAPIWAPTSSLQTNLYVDNCNIYNAHAGQGGILVSTANSTGTVNDCTIRCDTQANAVNAQLLVCNYTSWADITSTNKSTVPANVSISSSSGPSGESFVFKKTLTSSAITTGGVLVCTANVGGVLFEEITLQTDSTSLAGMTNLTLVSSSAKGTLTFYSQAISGLGANVTAVATGGATTAMKNGQVLQAAADTVTAKATGSNGTGGGTVDLYFKCKRVDPGAYLS